MQMSGVLNWFGRQAPTPEPPRGRNPRGAPLSVTGAERNLIPEGPAPT